MVRVISYCSPSAIGVSSTPVISISPPLVKHHHCCCSLSAVSPSTAVTNRPYSLSSPWTRPSCSSAPRRNSASVLMVKSFWVPSPWMTSTVMVLSPAAPLGFSQTVATMAAATNTSRTATAMIFFVFADIKILSFLFSPEIVQRKRENGRNDSGARLQFDRVTRFFVRHSGLFPLHGQVF